MRAWIFAWVFGVTAVLLTGFAVGQPLIYRQVFEKPPPAGTLDAPTVFGTMIGLLAVAVAAFGIGTWKLLERQTVTVARERAAYAAAASLVETAAVFWNQHIFEIQENTGITFTEAKGVEHSIDSEGARWRAVDSGIGVTRWLESGIRLLELADNRRRDFTVNPDTADLAFRIANNLAFVLAERGNKDDVGKARALAGELKANLEIYPAKRDVWTDTIEAVDKRWP